MVVMFAFAPMQGGAALLADTLRGPAERWGHMEAWGHMAGWGWVMGLFCLVAIALLVTVLVSVLRGSVGRGGSQPLPSNRALDLLDERFAKGEIDREEYLSRKAELRR
jgi:putative membrane protein